LLKLAGRYYKLILNPHHLLRTLRNSRHLCCVRIHTYRQRHFY